MKIFQALAIILCSVLIISCGAKDDANKPGEAKPKETKAVPKIENTTAPSPSPSLSQDDILKSQMDALNKAKNVEKMLIQAKAERDKRDKETLGM